MFLYRILLLSVLTLSMVSLQETRARQAVPDLNLFLQPLKMTAAGLHCFFDQLYNSKRYIEDFYPNNFTHLEQFLEHGLQTRQERNYTKAIFSLFSQKTKGCMYISAYAFDELLSGLPRLVEYHFAHQAKNAEQKKKEIKQLLWQEFLNNFDLCKENPHLFFDTLSESILKTVDPDAHQDVSTEYLRQTIIRFVEGGLSKILWDPTDKHIWGSVKRIGDHLIELTKHNIITDTDDLNDLAWSLVHRLCYFIDITGSDLPREFYEEINVDLKNATHPLLLLEEQEELAESKRSVLERVVVEGIARQQAKQYGLITEALPI
jgi:hypothetical protein